MHKAECEDQKRRVKFIEWTTFVKMLPLDTGLGSVHSAKEWLILKKLEHVHNSLGIVRTGRVSAKW